jgi:hypothetical protein
VMRQMRCMQPPLGRRKVNTMQFSRLVLDSARNINISPLVFRAGGIDRPSCCSFEWVMTSLKNLNSSKLPALRRRKGKTSETPLAALLSSNVLYAINCHINYIVIKS